MDGALEECYFRGVLMERLGVPVMSCALLLVCTSFFTGLHASPFIQPPFVLSNLCKFCDVKPSECNGTETHCIVHCDISSICEHSYEICVSAWRRNGENKTVETVCHNPSVPFHGVMLKDFNNKECVMKSYEQLGPDFYICSCSKNDECNAKLIFSTAETPMKTNPLVTVVLFVLVPVTVLVIMLLSLIYFCYVHSLRSAKMKHGFSDTHSILTIKHKRSDSISNWLNHNTELLPVHLDEMVGKGRFAEVHRARLGQMTSENGVFQMVAVKIFPVEEFLSWKTEREIFLDPELCHENIVHFLAAEKHIVERQLWLITAYHSRGNLRDYLKAHQLEWEELCKMGGDVTRGVAHLHSEQNAVGGVKTAIAHRDLKSDNVLVKEDRSCCICDFGLSIRLDSNMSTEELSNRGQVGTARYMAPELLESRLNLENIESFKQADVYSMALVLWEITSRCSANGEVKEYEPPFGKLHKPCIESMKDTVIRDRERPEILLSWRTHQGVNLVCEMIEECWDEDAEARLTASCVSERFDYFSDPSFLYTDSINEDKSSSLPETEMELLHLIPETSEM
ncbi:TGF-beta receptor type-2-like isoform X2 [Tachysurus vachellii]|uniref:TGF-beta receptor type-2-like isoform X2 n=1 Tax=Tachysurus vachellii TaxID=175792 RepID=UPI00296B26FE|nr:TGF-beta receptor type-2-like isoform X2 [Tachysurus vachellii]